MDKIIKEPMMKKKLGAVIDQKLDYKIINQSLFVDHMLYALQQARMSQ